MTTLKFQGKDFFRNKSPTAGPYGDPTILIVEAAEFANAKLDEWLKSAVKVYGEHLRESNLNNHHGSGWYFYEESTRFGKPHKPTHSALLIGITELEKKVCEHRNEDIQINNFGVTALCKCGAKLKATWQEV